MDQAVWSRRSSWALPVVSVDESIAGLLLELAGHWQRVLGAELRQAAVPGLDVITVLQQELQALLDGPEPLASHACTDRWGGFVAVIGVLPQ